MDFAVRFDNVTCRIGKRAALDRVSFGIERGAVTGVLGPNGAGKSTLLNAVLGLREPSAGTLTVLGRKMPNRSADLRRRIGVVLQDNCLYDELTAFENLWFAASLYPIDAPDVRVKAALELLGLSDRANDRVGALSGGLKRRVALARALLHEPELLVIDEPTLGVDVEARHTLWSHLKLLRSRGATLVVATNYLDEAVALCDLVGVLREGRLLLTDTPQALVARAGCCLDIDCLPNAVDVIGETLRDRSGVLRVVETATGVSVFVCGSVVPDSIARAVLEATSIQGLRIRAADLAEVFQSIEEAE